jgi:hypothetical protein
MTYLRARWYDGYLNQFVSPDPIVPDYRNPQSINRYTYVFGNPINFLDASGLYPDYEKCILLYRYGITLEEDEFEFFRHEKKAILETVIDFSRLLGGVESFKRNLALSKVKIGQVPVGAEFCEVGDYCLYYDPPAKTITVPPNWYLNRGWFNDFNGRPESAMNQLCMEDIEELHGFPIGTFPSSKVMAKFFFAHELAHAFHTGNPDVLESFKSHVKRPGGPIGKLNESLIIRKHAYDIIFPDREIFADTFGGYLYLPELLNQQMQDWMEDEMPKVLL